MELGPKNHNGDGLLGPNSIIVVYMDPLGMFVKHWQGEAPPASLPPASWEPALLPEFREDPKSRSPNLGPYTTEGTL